MLRNFILLLVLLLIGSARAQDFYQVVKGVILNEETKLPLADVTIRLTAKDFSVETMSGADGNFMVEKVPVGRLSVMVSANAYENRELDNILVTSGKEVDLTVTLAPQPKELNTITVGGQRLKGEPRNRMASVSTYVLKIEETQKFAGSWDDPMRLVTSYPGIIQLNSGFNSFTVRGNAPVGMLYRLEGIPIHNPNHFASIGSTGGFVTQFSTQLLTTSEFFAGAFPAEFGNATTAVFDFKFRNGNRDKYEHAARVNVFGVDFATEGPFKKGGKASYLINYRYSSLGILARALRFESIVPAYQDLSFNLNFPTKKWGTFKLFGIGGFSDLTIAAEQDSTQWDGNKNRVQRSLGSDAGALGLVHYKSTSKGYWHSVAAASAGRYYDNADYFQDNLTFAPRELNEYTDSRLTFTTDYNHRFGRRHSNKTGLIVTHIDHSYQAAQYTKFTDNLDTLGTSEGATQIVQAFTQSKFNVTEKLTLNAGIHFLHFVYNGKSAVEPRLGLNYKLNERSLIALGYGMHSRVEDLSVYFYETKDAFGTVTQPNRDLGLMQSHQAVLRFAHQFTQHLKFTAETYYQHLTNVPADPNGTFSVQNLFWQFPTIALQNVGEGKNYGLELSLQRYTKNGFYWMVNGAVFNAQYKAGDGVWRNTEFNQQFSYNLLAGKEFELKPKPHKKRLLGLNANLRHSGGTWQNRVDEDLSKLYGWTRYDFDNPYSERQPDLVNFDFTLSLKGIHKRYTGEFSVQIKNLMNNRTVLKREWDEKIEEVKEIRDYGIIPVIGYKIWF